MFYRELTQPRSTQRASSPYLVSVTTKLLPTDDRQRSLSKTHHYYYSSYHILLHAPNLTQYIRHLCLSYSFTTIQFCWEKIIDIANTCNSTASVIMRSCQTHDIYCCYTVGVKRRSNPRSSLVETGRLGLNRF